MNSLWQLYTQKVSTFIKYKFCFLGRKGMCMCKAREIIVQKYFLCVLNAFNIVPSLIIRNNLLVKEERFCDKYTVLLSERILKIM